MKAAELTSREQDILTLICEGRSNRAIADELVLSVGTVKWYNKQIFAKLSVSNRTEATVRVRELGLLTSPAPQSVESSAHTAHNLPTQLTSFVGRKHELKELQSLLVASRLITVTGTGGIGKTRLAQEFARSQLDAFPDGVYLVALADLTNTDGIIFAIAEALGFQFQRGSEPLQQLLEHLRQRRILLLLDNFEQLLDGSSVVSQFLTATEAVSVLATSREPLNLYGEMIYIVRGLSLLTDITADHIERQSEAVDLFTNRAKAIYSPFKTSSEAVQQITHICELVEGMPLAIELAATWVDTLQLSEIVDEIARNLDFLQSETHDARHGHNSIRATFLRSWILLDEDQQTAFRRVALFRGGFNREAAQAIASVHYTTLKALVMKSLLQFDPDQGRYQLHQLLQQFAYEKLEEYDEAQISQDRHAAFFAGFADRQWQATKGEEQYAALRRIEADIENIRAAWDYWTQTKNIAQLKKLFHAVWVIYDVRGWYPAGARLFQDTIETLKTLATADVRASIGWLTAVKGMFVVTRSLASREGYELCQEGVLALRELDRKDYLLVPLLGLFKTSTQVGEFQVAHRSAEECLEIATDLQDMWGIVKAHHLLALIAIDDRNYELASRLAHSALNICKIRRDRWSESTLCIEVLATISIHQKQHEQARAWLGQGLEAAASIHYAHAKRAAYFQLGYVAVLSNNYAEAAMHWNNALAISDQVSLGTTGFFGKEIEGEW